MVISLVNQKGGVVRTKLENLFRGKLRGKGQPEKRDPDCNKIVTNGF
jgi:hypothetical protein